VGRDLISLQEMYAKKELKHLERMEEMDSKVLDLHECIENQRRELLQA